MYIRGDSVESPPCIVAGFAMNKPRRLSRFSSGSASTLSLEDICQQRSRRGKLSVCHTSVTNEE